MRRESSESGERAHGLVVEDRVEERLVLRKLAGLHGVPCPGNPHGLEARVHGVGHLCGHAERVA